MAKTCNLANVEIDGVVGKGHLSGNGIAYWSMHPNFASDSNSGVVRIPYYK